MFGWFLAQLVPSSPGFLNRFLNRAIRRRLIVIVEASPVLNIRDGFASLIIAAHFVLRAVRALLRAGLAFVRRCRRRGGWSERLVFGFGFVCGRASSGFPFSVCILLLRVFRVSVHSYWGCVSLDMDVLLLDLILCWGSEAPRVILLQGVAVRS